MGTAAQPLERHEKSSVAAMHAQTKNKKTSRSDITPDPCGHRPQHPHAQGRTQGRTYLCVQSNARGSEREGGGGGGGA